MASGIQDRVGTTAGTSFCFPLGSLGVTSSISLSSGTGCTGFLEMGHFKITGRSSTYALLGTGSPSHGGAFGNVFSTTFFNSERSYGFVHLNLSICSAGTTSNSIAPKIANSVSSSLRFVSAAVTSTLDALVDVGAAGDAPANFNLIIFAAPLSPSACSNEEPSLITTRLFKSILQIPWPRKNFDLAQSRIT